MRIGQEGEIILSVTIISNPRVCCSPSSKNALASGDAGTLTLWKIWVNFFKRPRSWNKCNNCSHKANVRVKSAICISYGLCKNIHVVVESYFFQNFQEFPPVADLSNDEINMLVPIEHILNICKYSIYNLVDDWGLCASVDIFPNFHLQASNHIRKDRECTINGVDI